VTPTEREAFIRAQTVIGSPPLCPDFRLHLATEITPLWQATEATLARAGLPPPFWAFCWPGAQVLARWVLEHPEIVRDRHVLDFAAGCGLAGFASLRAGAARVTAVEIDPFAVEACRLNAALNGVEVEAVEADVVGTDAGWDVVLAGDVCYERPAAERIDRWLKQLARRGARVFVGDPGRTYLPSAGLVEVARWKVPTTRELEDREERETRVFEVRGA
jgi:predicted nicotinamide N-methyase